MMENSFLNSSIEEYLEKLSSNLPTPGGGSAAALVASCGVGCLLMVANFTLNKKGYEEYQKEIEEIINKLSNQNNLLKKCIDKDVLAYKKVSEIYKLPKSTPKEIEMKEQLLQQAFKEAATVAFETMKIAYTCVPFSERLLKIGNKNLLTDVACGILFLSSGIQAAKYNVVINLKNIKDSKFVNKIRKEIKKIVTDTKVITKKVLQKIQI